MISECRSSLLSSKFCQMTQHKLFPTLRLFIQQHMCSYTCIKIVKELFFFREKSRTIVSHTVIFSSQFTALIAPYLEEVMQVTWDSFSRNTQQNSNKVSCWQTDLCTSITFFGGGWDFFGRFRVSKINEIQLTTSLRMHSACTSSVQVGGLLVLLICV